MSVNEQLTTSVFPLSTYDKKYAEFVNKVLKESADSFEKEKKYNVLLNLYNVFGGIFERALELYEQGRITYIFASESAGVAPYSNRNNARYLVQVKGLSGAIYTFFPDINYCICASFRCQVLNNKSLFTCKHVLAVWLASVTKEKSATCFGTDNGLKVTVEDAKCMQASAYIPIRVFQVFNLKEDVIFKINLNVLVECLCMFWGNINSQGNSVALQLCYKGNGHPVTVLIEENGIITDCSLKTQDPDELLDFHLEPENVLNKVVLQTELLKDVLSELDSTSELINLLLSPSPPFFRISTAGLAGLCHIELPHDGELVDNFQCTSKAISSYKLSHIKPAMKALSCANKVSLRTDTCGLLCFQYMVKTEETHICYIEYYISPVIDEDE
ncbi:Cell cycle checkpoint protein RAD1 [Eufriesea mexicana]|uniref:Cell cycle checkpoint protein RAD1 n=1 Tax=Eufriesea mexicana TaxID=516756 RepID=A0A310SFU2_9HYME|nr:Cell cycle checkpoint protein RAD1 [Eufriesea mexicana]